MNTRTIEITMPDGYTADEVREHLAKLPERKPEPGAVAINAYQKAIERGSDGGCVWSAVEQACREGYVEKDKIEAALEKPILCNPMRGSYVDGFDDACERIVGLIREAMK